MASNHDADVIVRSTIELGHNLDLTVIAEGAGSREVWSHVVGLDCDATQGFFIARPIPAGQFTHWEHQSPWRSARPHS
jgi:EAL domain-containing protein (putative c-di-GMP-specific phosphodiesterase class I)